MPLTWGASPRFIRSFRKGTALPHIGRQIREREFPNGLVQHSMKHYFIPQFIDLSFLLEYSRRAFLGSLSDLRWR